MSTVFLKIVNMSIAASWLILAVLVVRMVSGGAERIGAAAEVLVPVAAGAYVLVCLGAVWLRREALISALVSNVRGAFSPEAVTGGVVGSGFAALRIGVSRGVFTNEAGMGTASMAHGSAEVDHPVEQGLMGIMEVFLDTIVICTLTALVILISGVPIPYGRDAGGLLTADAFTAIYGKPAVLWLTAAMILFALATVLGWGLYGARCTQFLFGQKVWKYFAAVQIPAVFAGAFLETASIWQLSEAVNGLMSIPNLITLAVLAPEAARLTKEYIQKSG